jgi:hypothetical protein
MQQMMGANNFLMGCNCIKLKECNSIVEMVRNSYSGFFATYMLQSQPQVYQCKYQKDEMYVCCPNSYGQNQFNHNNHHQQQHHNLNFHQTDWQKNFNKMWNWNTNGYHESAEEREHENSDENDERPKPLIDTQPYLMPQFTSYPIQGFHPFSFPFTNNVNNPYSFIANHEDVRTHKNCPPQISQEFTLPPDHMFFNENQQQAETTTTTTTAAPPPVPWLPEKLQTKTSLINSDECGKSSSMRIIGGEDTGEGRFLWVARLAYRNKSSGKVSHRCGGSLISQHYVLTAGHCVSNLIDELEL